MAGTERQRELRRLRTRRKKTQQILSKAKKANPAAKTELRASSACSPPVPT